VVAVPESVLPDAKKGLLYISLINGGPWEKDGKGGIAKLSADGTGYDSTWITVCMHQKAWGCHVSGCM
jgi:hypothetical protein